MTIPTRIVAVALLAALTACGANRDLYDDVPATSGPGVCAEMTNRPEGCD